MGAMFAVGFGNLTFYHSNKKIPLMIVITNGLILLTSSLILTDLNLMGSVFTFCCALISALNTGHFIFSQTLILRALESSKARATSLAFVKVGCMVAVNGYQILFIEDYLAGTWCIILTFFVGSLVFEMANDK